MQVILVYLWRIKIESGATKHFATWYSYKNSPINISFTRDHRNRTLMMQRILLLETRRKRGQFNERFKCLWSSLISRKQLDHRWFVSRLFEKKSASTNRRSPQKGGGSFEGSLDHIPGDSVKQHFKDLFQTVMLGSANQSTRVF